MNWTSPASTRGPASNSRIIGAIRRSRSSPPRPRTPRIPGEQVREFKEIVRAFHKAGIEVILDVVYNHTCEGNEHGPDAELSRAGQLDLLHARQERALLQLLRLRQHPQLQPPGRPRPDHRQPGLLADRAARRRLPLRPGLDPGPGRRWPGAGRSAADPAHRRAPAAGRHQADGRGVGRRPDCTSSASSRPGAAGPSSTAISATTCAIGAQRPQHHRRLGQADLRQPRHLRRFFATPLPLHQFRHLPRRLHSAATWSATTTSTTGQTARTTATAAVETSAGTAARRGRPTTPRSTPCASGR